MHDRDPEMDALLKPLRQEKNNDLHLARWKQKLQERKRSQNPNLTPKTLLVSIAASLLIGFLLGQFSTPLFSLNQESENFYDSSATLVEHFVNIE